MADDQVVSSAAAMAVNSSESESESEDERDAPGWTPQLIALDKQNQLEGERLFEQKVRFVWQRISRVLCVNSSTRLSTGDTPYPLVQNAHTIPAISTQLEDRRHTPHICRVRPRRLWT
jgi:hypothetical protein